MSTRSKICAILRTSWNVILVVMCALLLPVNSSTPTNFLENSLCSPGSAITCSCSIFSNDMLLVNCTSKGFTEIPAGIPHDSKILMLKNNSITWINSGNFLNLHLLEILHINDNRIKNIAGESFDHMYNLRTLNLQNNLLTRIEPFMFRYLSNLETLDLSNNQISRVMGDSFVTLTNIKQIAFTGNGLICDCEIRKLKQWYDFMSTEFGVSVLDAYCADKNNYPIQDVSDFGGCTGQDLFKQGIDCEGCSQQKSARECEATKSIVQCLTEDKPVCYSKLTFTTSGLELSKGCESFRTCVENAKTVNSQCFGTANTDVHCKYCCTGDTCNHGTTLGRTGTITYDLTVLLRGTMESNLFIGGSLAYTQFQTGIENILTNQALGTYHVFIRVIEPRSGEFAVVAAIDCITLVEMTELKIYNFIYSELQKVQRLYEHDVMSWRLTHPSLCPAELIDSPKGTFSWSAAEIGASDRAQCPSYSGSRIKYATRDCLMGIQSKAEWSAMSVGDCLDYNGTTTTTTTTTTTAPPVNTTADLTVLSRQPATNANADDQASELVKISEASETYTSTDVRLTVDKLEELINLDSTHSSIQRGGNLAKTMSNFLDTPQVQLSAAEKDSNSPTRFLQTVQNLVDKSATNSFSAVNPNLALFSRGGITSSNFNGYTIQSNNKPGEKFSPNSVEVISGSQNNTEQSYMVLPADLPQSLSPNERSAISKITFAVFAEDKIFSAITGKLPASGGPQVGDDSDFIRGPNSLIMAASIPNVDVRGLQNPVLQRFVHTEKNSKNPACVFWDENLQTTSKWSGEGCSIYETVANSHTTCACDHLTNFALLMDIYGTGGGLSDENRLAMSIISYVGCGISLFSLLLTLLTYCLFKKLRSSNPSKILINLCIALIAVNVIFILGQQAYALDNSAACKVVAILLHYFLLSAMTWMAVEAFYMYLALVKIFNTYIRRFLIKCCLVGWGIPLVVVVVTLGINKTDNYGRQPGDICWLNPIPFYSAFLAPVLLILILNTIAFIMVTRQLFGMSSKKITKSDKSSTLSRLRGAVGVVILLGLTWMFAIFAVGGTGGIIVQYLFTIFNSLQGLFIFIFYCFLHKEARKNWTRTLPCCDASDEKGSTQTSREEKGKKYTAVRSYDHTRGRYPSYADSTI